jgi:hypothetical protein
MKMEIFSVTFVASVCYVSLPPLTVVQCIQHRVIGVFFNNELIKIGGRGKWSQNLFRGLRKGTENLNQEIYCTTNEIKINVARLI